MAANFETARKRKNKKNIVNTGNTTGSSIIIILDVAYLKIIPFVK